MEIRSTTEPQKSLQIEEIERGFTQLLGITLDAFKFYPPLYLSSILGKLLTVPPIHEFSEYTLLDPWHPLRTLRCIFNTTIPALPIKPPPFTPPILEQFFFRPTKILHRPDHTHDYTSFPDEAWFFINGIMTNDDVAQLNAAYISDLFHRPITIIQNTTQSILIDLKECAFDKEWRSGWGDIQEASRKAFPPIYNALKNPLKKKVIVLAHSQGTIIMSVVLNMLKSISAPSTQMVISATHPAFSPVAQTDNIPHEEITDASLSLEMTSPGEPIVIFPYEGLLEPEDFSPLSQVEFAKLEIYCFANCANQMTYFIEDEGSGRPIPWIESFGNEFDLVARLGMFAPNKNHWQIKISGSIYLRQGAWGHLFNEHYLKPIDKAQRLRLKRGGQNRNPLSPFHQLNAENKSKPKTPRLFHYINGGTI